MVALSVAAAAGPVLSAMPHAAVDTRALLWQCAGLMVGGAR